MRSAVLVIPALAACSSVPALDVAWTTMQPPSLGHVISALTASPEDDLGIYAGTIDDFAAHTGVRHVSGDAGNSWNGAGDASLSAVRDLAWVPAADDATATQVPLLFTGDWGYAASTRGEPADWTQLAPGSGAPDVAGDYARFAVAPMETSSIWLGANGGLWHSADAGAHWATITAKGGAAIGGLAADPSDPTRVFVVAAAGGLARAGVGSVDDLAQPCVTSAVVVPGGVVFAGTRGGSCGDSVIRSDDHGATWSATSDGVDAEISALVVDPADASTIYALASPDGASPDGAIPYDTQILRTQDGGRSWAEITGDLGGHPTSLAASPTSLRELYVGTAEGTLFRLGP